MRRLATLAAYFAVFWVALPWGLGSAALRLDRRLEWGPAPSAWGVPVLALGVGLMASAMAVLWRRGGGLPVSALPPPRFTRSGPYRLVRHPIYLGFNIALLGAGLAGGSRALAFLVAPAFLPAWLAYARLEERSLLRRFGGTYRRYRDQVGLFPRLGLDRPARTLVALGAFSTRVEGGLHVPRRGPAILIANHACYLDPVYLAAATWRLVHFPTTAEAYRAGWLAWVVRHFLTVPVRRYRPDTMAWRELLRRLADGELVGVYPEGERASLGGYQGADPAVARLLSKIPVPVIPVGLSGNYDCGPRWAGRMRRRPVHVRVGPPLVWDGRDPVRVVDDALRGLLDADPQPVRLDGLPRERLELVLWRCPRCGEEPGWRAATLACSACGLRLAPTPGGRLVDESGHVATLGEWGRAVRQQAEGDALLLPAGGWRDRSPTGRPLPLEALGDGTLRLGPEGVEFGTLRLAWGEVTSVSVERADTLQVATHERMWQFRLQRGSVFRLHAAAERWRAPSTRPRPIRVGAARPRWLAPAEPPQQTSVRWPWAGLAVAVGLLVAQSATLLRPLMDGFGAGGVAGPMALGLAATAAFAAAVDLLVQAVAPYRWRGSTLIRGGAVVAAGAAVALVSGQVPGAVAYAFGLSAFWTALALGHRTWPLATLAAVWALTPALARPAPPPAPLAPLTARGTSIAVIVLDTVRLDRTSTFGFSRDTTPNLSVLAARGVRFERTYSTSCWSLPAHASLFTGLMPARHGADLEHLALDPGIPTLAGRLAARGYQTAGFSANPLVAPGNGMARGFVSFEEPWREYTVRESLLAWRVWNRFLAPERDKAGGEIVAGVRRFVASRDAARPFFLFVNLMEAHAPYQEVPRRWRGAFTDPALGAGALEAVGERSHMAQVLGEPVLASDIQPTLDLYDGAVAAADAELGAILSLLEPGNLVVALSDHGELLGERGVWGHSFGLDEALIRIPLVMAGPGLPRGATVQDPVSILDVMPTLLGLVGLPGPPMDGLDLRGVIAGRESVAGRVLLAEHQRTDFLTAGWQALHPFADHRAIRARRVAAVQGTLKRVLAEDGSDLGFDLGLDPRELRPFPGGTTRLAVSLPHAGAVPPARELDAAQAEALRALGYLR